MVERLESILIYDLLSASTTDCPQLTSAALPAFASAHHDDCATTLK